VLITSLPRKHLLTLLVVEMLYRRESPLSLTLSQLFSNALHRFLPLKATQLRQGINEYQPNRENMLESNNFRMVNVMELVSKSQKSQKSHKSQRFQGFKLIVQVHC
jgi:hypothetical protein